MMPSLSKLPVQSEGNPCPINNMFLMNLHGFTIPLMLFPAHGTSSFTMPSWPAGRPSGQVLLKDTLDVVVTVARAVTKFLWAPNVGS